MIHIHREQAKSDFLGIKNANWQAASRDLGAHGLRLYLYLAANANNYTLALSPADIRQTIGMPQSTYRDQFQLLVDKGYLVANSSNGFDFFEVPQTRHAPIQCEEHAASGVDFENQADDGQATEQKGEGHDETGFKDMLKNKLDTVSRSHFPGKDQIVNFLRLYGPHSLL